MSFVWMSKIQAEEMDELDPSRLLTSGKYFVGYTV